ncbi:MULTISPECIES: UvrD-helicase domain-containing protein [Sorangium]|uniref:DNA 3'-5' helicase n=1 Tax=Sorangium cellulosum TaxID=56 RepID=A0A4P2QND5_SORCE|nr:MULTISPECIES: UvrD-helicase domain-containing protein [Sorangium]AUX31545.1 exodeoxyribonuclease V subunit beta [Sorangium cellulosum]WCQ90923.1 DNA helicase [Sorangium sp. Soce836]
MSAAPHEAELAEGDALIYAFRRNVVVAASAGTGKTHRLTALYVLLTLGLTSVGQPDAATAAPPVPPDRIVATTFSRAAAREIAHRIERSLREIARWDGESSIPFADILRARQAAVAGPPGAGGGAALPLPELRKRAEDALARLPAARVDTLHGVAKQIVDRHAIAMGLSPSARILDEEEAQALSDLAVDEALSRAFAEGGERAEAARALVAATGGVEGARSEVTRLLDRLDEDGLAPRRLAVSDHAAEARALARELRRLAAESAALGGAAFREPAAALVAALGREGDGAPFPASAASAPLIELLTQRRPHKSKCTPADEALLAFREALPGETNRDKALQLLGFLREAPALSRREAQIVELLEEIRERLAAIRRTEGGLGFGDLLRAARDGLRDDPAIGEAVRGSVDVLLVDEFQDTSAVQRDLVYLLRERDDAALARPAGVAPTAAGLWGHGLFLVGDRKQSIYGFRGADVSIFCRVCAELAGAAAGRALELSPSLWSAEPSADFVALRESRRSTPELLAFINAFSARDFAQDRAAGARDGGAGAPRDFEIAYSAAEHLVAAPGGAASGPTQVALVDDDGSAPDGVDALVRDARGQLREALIAAAYIARRVRGAAAGGGAAEGAGGDLRFRDVAVLARRRSTIPLVELALARLEIPYVVAGRALFDAPEVRDVAAILRLLLDPRDLLALATVLRGPAVALSDTALAVLAPPGRGLTVPLLGRWSSAALAPGGRTAGPEDEGPGGARALPALARLSTADRERLEAFRARFAGLRGAALRSTPGEAIRAAISAFDLDRVLAALPRAQARLGNVDRLISIARRRGGSLASFVRWLDRRIRDEADEPEAAVFSPEDDAVRLTTIHASKGLDFPAVVLLDLNAEPRADQPGLSYVPAAGDRPAALLVRHHARRVDRTSRLGALYDVEASAHGPLLPLSTPALQAARAEVRARERAERQRLTYVAITRAKRELVLVGTSAKPRSGSAWLTLKGPSAEDAAPLAGAIGATLEARSLLAEARPPAPGTDAYARAAPVPRAAPAAEPARARTVLIAAASLAAFQGCARRFRLRHLLGIGEPAGEGQLGLFDVEGPPEQPGEERVELEDGADPRPPGRAAHRVLQRWPRARWGEPTEAADVVARLAFEGLAPHGPDALRTAEGIARFLGGPYARQARAEEAALLREEALVLDVEPQGAGERRGARLALSLAIDLVVLHPGGLVDVIEVKRARPRADLAPYELRLRAYALALRRRHPDRPVRAGVLFLGAEVEPVWLEGSGPMGAIADEEHARFERELARLAERFSEAAAEGRFDGVPIEACRRLRCGFVRACHG